ncbi:MAG: hypothetical protein FWD53_04195 [Phycisphaerales bacterium]|nr:hypothetical protein [Phycisphaerales bacterium]
MSRILVPSVLMLSLLLAACGSVAPKTADDAKLRHANVTQAIADMKAKDPTLEKLFKSAHAYAIFPNVVAGGLGVGGFSGTGEVYQGGKFVGYAKMSGANIGYQIGGQSFVQVIFFQNATAFGNFKAGTLEFDAKATAVAASSGAGAQADYANGIVAFAMPRKGLMAQAAIGGQKFSFEAADRIGGTEK